MASPKTRITRSRRGMRRSHHGLERKPVQNCPTTSELMRPHRACQSSDGAIYYKGKPITAPKYEMDAESGE